MPTDGCWVRLIDIRWPLTGILLGTKREAGRQISQNRTRVVWLTKAVPSIWCILGLVGKPRLCEMLISKVKKDVTQTFATVLYYLVCCSSTSYII